jgi:hypothetical protein
MDGASGNAGQDGSYDEPQVTWPEQGHEHFLPGMTADDRPPRRHRAGCVVLVLVSVAVSAGVAGAFAVNALPRKQDAAGMHSVAPRKENTAGFRPTAPPPLPGDARAAPAPPVDLRCSAASAPPPDVCSPAPN